MELVEKHLQDALQEFPYGDRLWRYPSSAGRKPVAYGTCKVYCTFSFKMVQLLAARALLCNQSRRDMTYMSHPHFEESLACRKKNLDDEQILSPHKESITTTDKNG